MKRCTISIFIFLIGTVAWADDVPSLIAKGDKCDLQIKTQEALQIYLQASQQSPNNAEILYRIAREYGLSMDDVTSPEAKRDRGEKALASARQAVAADARNAKAQLALAISYGRLAPFLDNKTKLSYAREVKAHADLALSLNPNDDLAYHVLGRWNYDVANFNSVLRVLASAIYGSLPAASNEEAVRDFKKAIALNPNRVANHVELGRAYVAMKQPTLAREEFTAALSLPSTEKDAPQKSSWRKRLSELCDGAC